MAPRFKQLLYQTYGGSHGATAFVGLPGGQLERESTFRDSLRDEVVRITGYEYREETGVYEDVDIHLSFFDVKDTEIINAFYSKPQPGCLAWLFHTQYYRAYKAGEEKIEPFIRIEIATSHDYPGIEIHKSIFPENELAQLIEQVASNLKLHIRRSNFPYSADEIMTSNRTFEIGE